jgi:hypothetical protein
MNDDVLFSSIEEQEDQQTLMIYPNPSSEFVYLRLKDISTTSQIIINIYDLSGKLVLQNIFAASELNEKGVDISSLVNGTYITTAQSGSDILRNKLIISRN